MESATLRQVYERSDSNTDVEIAMLNAGKAAVEANSDKTDYNPSFMLVTTYEEIPPDPASIDTNEVGGLFVGGVHGVFG